MSNKIARPAARIKQGNLCLYSTSLKVRDLIKNNFYNIERLDPENANEKGYQRLLNKNRAKKLCDYLVKSQNGGDAFLPTSIFMATDKDIPFNEDKNSIEIDIDVLGPFNVVDGQHRIEGLKMAASKDEKLMDFEVPVNIAVNLPLIQQMYHFLIVNTTQRTVDEAVAQRIRARLSNLCDTEPVGTIPRWLENSINKREDDKALKYIDYLLKTSDSPWCGKITMANEEKRVDVITQKSFVNSIKRYILVSENPILDRYKDSIETQQKIFLNYWKAIVDVINPTEKSVLFKSNGVDLFCMFGPHFFQKMVNSKSLTVASMKKWLMHTFDNVEGEAVGIGHSDFWRRGGQASFFNRGKLNSLNKELVVALNRPSDINGIDEIEI